jgi:hypothetical protein
MISLVKQKRRVVIYSREVVAPLMIRKESLGYLRHTSQNECVSYEDCEGYSIPKNGNFCHIVTEHVC